jgi:hypothetical protein
MIAGDHSYNLRKVKKSMECKLYQLNELKRSKVQNNVSGIYALIHNDKVIYVG